MDEDAEFFIKNGVLYKKKNGKVYPASPDEAWSLADIMLDDDCVFAYQIVKWLTNGRLDKLDDTYIEAFLECNELPKKEYEKVKMEAIRRGLI